PQHLDERAVVACGSCREGIERRQMFEDLALLLLREAAAANLVVVARATRVHHQRALGRQCVLEGEMDLIGSSDDRAYGTDGRMNHHRRASRDAQRAESIGQFASGVHAIRETGGFTSQDCVSARAPEAYRLLTDPS